MKYFWWGCFALPRLLRSGKPPFFFPLVTPSLQYAHRCQLSLCKVKCRRCESNIDPRVNAIPVVCRLETSNTVEGWSISTTLFHFHLQGPYIYTARDLVPCSSASLTLTLWPLWVFAYSVNIRRWRNQVSWSLTSSFSTNMPISETKGQGWRAIPNQWRNASDILTSTLAAFFCPAATQKGKGLRGSFKLIR